MLRTWALDLRVSGDASGCMGLGFRFYHIRSYHIIYMKKAETDIGTDGCVAGCQR